MQRLFTSPKPAGRPKSAAAEPVSPFDIEELQRKYAGSGLHLIPDCFALYRIIGNDLYPRHRLGISRENLQFILEHEPSLVDCEKRWVVNRILDPAEERAILALLDEHGQSYIHLPFVRDDYARIGWDLDCFPQSRFLLAPRGPELRPDADLLKEARARERKNSYVMNNNGARNAALRAGRGIAKWVLPWDGNCFLTETAWAEIRAGVLAQPYLPYFIVPMARSVANTDLLSPDYRPGLFDEPQILFRRDAREEFDPGFVYGRRSKVSLLWRLGVPGRWDRWICEPWDLPRPPLSPDARQYGICGWVSRLESGQEDLEGHDSRARRRRSAARAAAIIAVLDRLDQEVMRNRLDPAHAMIYDEEILDGLRAGGPTGPLGEIARALEADAQAVIARGTFSVLDKTGCAPGGDRRDYWHPAPYWWPDPSAPDGLPYIHRDGQRRPGTQLYEPGSEAFDRSSLQRVLDGATISGLAWRITGNRLYAEHGAALMSRWFIDPDARMNPHLRFAQTRTGWNNNEGNRSGIIEMRDIALLLDAARLLEHAGTLSAADWAAFRSWLGAYLDWLLTSRQGREACSALNNHGTYFDLQVAAIAAYLGDAAVLTAAFRRARARINIQFDPDGSQPHELRRPASLHYCCFNLQGWISLATIAGRCGEDLWEHRSITRGSIGRGLEWLIRSTAARTWPYPQEPGFDWSRLVPLQAALARRSAGEAADLLALHRACPGHAPQSGIRPYWYL